jgi:hypothetical protein
MAFKENPTLALYNVQRAQNILADYNQEVGSALKSLLNLVQLSFWYWESYAYNTGVRTSKNIWSTPIWDSDMFSGFSHLPLCYSDSVFTKITDVPFESKTKTDEGDFTLTVRTAPNSQLLDFDFSDVPYQEWAHMPIKAGICRIFIFKAEKNLKTPLHKIFSELDNPDKIDGKWSTTNESGILSWANDFDLLTFITNTAIVAQLLKKALVS